MVLIFMKIFVKWEHSFFNQNLIVNNMFFTEDNYSYFIT